MPAGTVVAQKTGSGGTRNRHAYEREKLAPLRQECEELTAIFVTILKRAKTS